MQQINAVDLGGSEMLSDLVFVCTAGDPDWVDQTQGSWFLSLIHQFTKQVADALGPHISYSTDNPGYLMISNNAGLIISPFHLAPFIKLIDLKLFLEMASSIRTSSENTICLSGSSTFSLTNAADIDFCEYTSSSGNRVPEAFFLQKKAENNYTLIQLSHADRQKSEPFDPMEDTYLCDTDRRRSLDSVCECKDQSWYFEFLAETKSDAFVSVTNKVVPVGPSARGYSWAYQEAVLAMPGFRTRELAIPSELARYVYWLKGEIEDFLEKKILIKALKRALSLAILMRLTDRANDIYSMLEVPELVLIGKESALKEIEKDLSNVPGRLRRKVEEFVLNERVAIVKEKRNIDFKVQEITDKCNSVLSEFSRLQAESKSRLG